MSTFKITSEDVKNALTYQVEYTTEFVGNFPAQRHDAYTELMHNISGMKYLLINAGMHNSQELENLRSAWATALQMRHEPTD